MNKEQIAKLFLDVLNRFVEKDLKVSLDLQLLRYIPAVDNLKLYGYYNVEFVRSAELVEFSITSSFLRARTTVIANQKKMFSKLERSIEDMQTELKILSLLTKWFLGNYQVGKRFTQADLDNLSKIICLSLCK